VVVEFSERSGRRVSIHPVSGQQYCFCACSLQGKQAGVRVAHRGGQGAALVQRGNGAASEGARLLQFCS
jgi:hypothetical protein